MEPVQVISYCHDFDVIIYCEASSIQFMSPFALFLALPFVRNFHIDARSAGYNVSVFGMRGNTPNAHKPGL